MPNDQQHDPRVSTAPERVAQAVGLSVAAVPGAPALSGTVTHGSTVTLTDPQNRLGSRTTAPFRHWQQGSEIYLNGTQSTAEVAAPTPDTTEVWGSFYSGGTSIVTDNLRHARVDQQYRGLGKGALIDPKAFDGNGLPDKLFLACWRYPGSDLGSMAISAYNSLSGTFQTNALRSLGEAVTITETDATVRTGYITMISGGYVSLDIAGTGWGSTSLNGATVSGDVSGASLVLDTSSYGAPSSTKKQRTYSGDPRAGAGGQGLSIITSQNSVINVKEFDSNGNFASTMANDFIGFDYSQNPEQWYLYQLEVDFSGSTGVVREKVNNQSVAEVAGLDKTNFPGSRGLFLSNLGLDQSGSPAPDADTGMREDFGEIVADNDLKRIVIGDAPALGDCTHIEIQRHTSWAADSVDFVVNQGSFDSLSGKYVFAVDSGFAELLGVAV